MDNFHLWKNDDSRWFVICLVIFSFILLIKEIFNSWYIIYAVSFIVLSVIVWFAFNFIVKKLKNRSVWLWYKYKKKYPIIIQYMPPKWINAAEAWLLYNLKVEPTDLTSLIYQWKFEWLIDWYYYIYVKKF